MAGFFKGSLLPPSATAWPSSRKGLSSCNRFGCCATRPFFAARKIGTRTVLAESPESVACAKRGLIFSGGRPGSGLPTSRKKDTTQEDQQVRDMRKAFTARWEDTMRNAARKYQVMLSAPGQIGAFCEHCPSPEKLRSNFWSSCAAANLPGGAMALSGRITHGGRRDSYVSPENPRMLEDR